MVRGRFVGSNQRGSQHHRPAHYHDQRALQLIDACLERGSFTSDAVRQISAELAAAERADAVVQIRCSDTPDGEILHLARRSRR
jgi:hypothetical protein